MDNVCQTLEPTSTLFSGARVQEGVSAQMQQDEIENKTSLAVKWLRFCPFTVEDSASFYPWLGDEDPACCAAQPKNFFKNRN